MFFVEHPQEEMIIGQDLRRIRRMQYQGRPALEFHVTSSPTPFYFLAEDEKAIDVALIAIKEHFNTIKLDGRMFHG